MDALTVTLCLFLCAFATHLFFLKKQKLPLPPGPPGEPLIGHLRKLPDDQNRAEVFYEWSLKYGAELLLCCTPVTELFAGEVFSLRVPGKTMIVLNKST